jgi:hypothetical protein
VPLCADLNIYIGDTYWSPRWAVVLRGEPVDLTTGWSVNSQVRRQPSAAEIIYEFDPDDTVITTVVVSVDGAQMETSAIQLYIPATVSAEFEPWTGAWDLEIVHPTLAVGGTPYRKTLVLGTARTRRDVTR